MFGAEEATSTTHPTRHSPPTASTVATTRTSISSIRVTGDPRWRWRRRCRSRRLIGCAGRAAIWAAWRSAQCVPGPQVGLGVSVQTSRVCELHDRPPSAVLLDALGTLVELEPPAPRLRAELARELGIEISRPRPQRAIEAEIAYYRAHLDEGRDPASLASLRRACAEALRRALPALRGAGPGESPTP